jgi:hypothetical protein
MTAPWVEVYSMSSSKEPWSKSLDGKTVLVISPFVETINIQHRNIHNVFPNIEYPKFILKTIKAPQTIGFDSNSKPTWFENLHQIQRRMLEEEFDVALIGAGAYSDPLAHYAKVMGKIGIHAGGGLQLFFGIIGKRWEKDWGSGEYVEKFFNKHWTRPSKDEKPPNAHLVEEGCYW